MGSYNDNLKAVLREFVKSIVYAMQMVMDSDVGINQKVGTNTLKGSDIYNELSNYFETTEDLDMAFELVHPYFQYIDGNGFEYAVRPHHSCPPINVLLPWAKKKGIDTSNETLEKIRWSIYRHGIKARPIWVHSLEELNDLWEDYADELFEALTEPLNDVFNE